MSKIQIRRDTAANFTSANPVLSVGEPSFETNTKIFKLGDGVTAYNSLLPQGDSRYVLGGGIMVEGSKYGFVGDDLTLNDTAFSAALADMKAAAALAKSYTLKLQRGTYRVSNSVPLDGANLAIQGDGADATIVKLTSAVAGSHGVFDVSATGCRLSGLTINANSLVNWGIYGNAAHRLSVKDVKVTGTVDHGSYLSSCSDVSLTRVTADTCGNSNNAAGFFTSGCDNLSLVGCMSKNSFQHGYYLLGGVNHSLTMTACRATGNAGVGISPRYSRMTVTGCDSWGNGQGGFSSSYPVEPSTKGPRAVVTGNTFGGSTGVVANEVVLLGIDNYVFVGNYVETSLATSAALMFSTLNEATCVGNQIVSTSTTAPTGGLRFSSVVGFTASGNTIKGAGTTAGNGVYVDTSSSGKVSDNRIDGWNTGLTITATACNDVQITFNELLNVTTRVSNSSTGTNCFTIGSDLPGTLTLPVHLVASQTTAPTLLAQTGAGTSPPTPTFLTASTVPTDERAVVQMGTGTTPAAGDQARMTFATAFGTSNRPVATCSAMNAATAALLPYISAVNGSFCTIAFANAPAASQPVATYLVAVQVRG